MRRDIWKVCIIALCLCFFWSLESNHAFAGTEEWFCNNCQQTVSGLYCSTCGTKVPDSAEDKEPIYIDGDWLLNISISNDKNLILAKYPVDVFLDNTCLGTIPHGGTYHTTLKVSKGIHKIRFYNSDDISVNGSSNFRILSPDMDYQCTIHSRTKGIEIRDETLNGSIIDHEEIEHELFIRECRDADYESYVRYPSTYTGRKTKLVGKVVSIQTNPLVGSIMEVHDWRGNPWIVKYRRDNSIARVLPGDRVECYGEYTGMASDSFIYSLLMGIKGDYPIIAVSYYSTR